MDMGTARNIRCLREYNQMTQQQLADRLGVTKSTVSFWESGTNKPRVDMIRKIADVFGVADEDIIYDPTRSNRVHNVVNINTQSEEQLLSIFRSMDSDKQQVALAALRAMAS